MTDAERLRKAIEDLTQVPGDPPRPEEICSAIVEEFLPKGMSGIEAMAASVKLVRAILDVAEGT